MVSEAVNVHKTHTSPLAETLEVFVWLTHSHRTAVRFCEQLVTLYPLRPQFHLVVVLPVLKLFQFLHGFGRQFDETHAVLSFRSIGVDTLKGGAHYASSNATADAGIPKAGAAKVTAIAKGAKHSITSYIRTSSQLSTSGWTGSRNRTGGAIPAQTVRAVRFHVKTIIINRAENKLPYELAAARWTHEKSPEGVTTFRALSASTNAFICEFCTQPRQPSRRNTRSSWWCSISRNLVEATGVEPVSENRSA